ncbi:MAG: hypothetical protein WA117_01975, partial [Verrucomicrobiia bacterium]
IHPVDESQRHEAVRLRNAESRAKAATRLFFREKNGGRDRIRTDSETAILLQLRILTKVTKSE